MFKPTKPQHVVNKKYADENYVGSKPFIIKQTFVEYIEDEDETIYNYISNYPFTDMPKDAFAYYEHDDITDDGRLVPLVNLGNAYFANYRISPYDYYDDKPGVVECQIFLPDPNDDSNTRFIVEYWHASLEFKQNIGE